MDFTEVKNLLSKSGTIYESHAEKVYTIVGGRTGLIARVVHELKAGLPWIGMLMILLEG